MPKPTGAGPEPMPEGIRPMLARLSDRLPADERDYAYELKWDGVRAIAYCDRGRLRLESRNLRDITPRYPELAALGRELAGHRAVLDGEVVALDPEGRPSFELLQGRMHLASEAAVRARMEEVPVAYMAFDLLHLDGHTTMGLPYRDRRELLEALVRPGPCWRVPEHHLGEGAPLLEASRERGLEGVVAKRLDSRYEPGRRSAAWLKVKSLRRQELVVGGWLPGAGARRGRIGALLAGYHDATPAEARARGEPQRLVYAGRVGTGFTDADLARLEELLAPLRRPDSPFAGRQPPREAVFVEPRLVAEVEFLAWTRTRTLRASSFKGLRDDKDPREV